MVLMLHVYIGHELNLCLMPMQGILYLLAFMHMPFSTYPQRVSFILQFHFHFVCSYLTGPSPRKMHFFWGGGAMGAHFFVCICTFIILSIFVVCVSCDSIEIKSIVKLRYAL